MINKYDVIVIGAGPAGCFTAIELAKKGYSVCIYEKQNRGYRKVCGDGLAMIGVEILSLMDYPIQTFVDNGAFPIKKYFYYLSGTLQEKKVKKPAFCLARNITDSLFQKYATDSFDIKIRYNSPVKNIEKKENVFYIGEDSADQVVIATGANARIMLNGKEYLVVDKNKPMGLSTIIKGRIVQDGFFMFDYKEEYEGTYGWIFTLGNGLYNVGIWRKNNYKMMKNQLNAFISERGNEWIGEHYEVVNPIRGAYMGIGTPQKSTEKGIYFVGDIANSSNENDGEGISKAIIAAKELVKAFPPKSN